ncbi:MAG: hypothetical protein QOD99_1573 [Chthoniobacter sp.]|jgi:TM2 domain-containing membrane protein YozV|nr:hypothetical protein [Chthoniobacter sp.]
MTAPEANVSAPKSERCPLCDAPLQNPNECSRCDWVRHVEEARERQRNPRDAISAIASMLWPGLGHFYKGYPKLAALVGAGGLLCFLWSITFFMFFGFLILPLYWVWVAVDAFFRKDLKYPNYYQT